MKTHDSSVSGTIRCSNVDNPQVMQIVPAFVAGLPGKVGKMTGCLEHNDLPGLQQMAHQLAGTCGGYGFEPVTEPARTVQQSIKEGKAIDLIGAEVKTLIDVIRRIEGYDASRELVPDGELAK
jgi:HPt (histidine-containing phosphotransfer) domain-containing protein